MHSRLGEPSLGPLAERHLIRPGTVPPLDPGFRQAALAAALRETDRDVAIFPGCPGRPGALRDEVV